MTIKKALRRTATLALALTPFAACGAPETAPGAALGVRAAQIRTEVGAGVAEAVFRHYNNPEAAKASYASPAIFLPGGGSIVCSASMLGPNILLTAAHCGETPDITASFLTYASDSTGAASKRFEDFRCRSLLSTWHSSDLILYFCDPNAAGESPGDKYGYFDLETGPLPIGAGLYSVWANPLDTPTSEYDVRFFSRGKITSTTSFGTFTTDPRYVKVNPATGLPDFSTSVQRPIAVSSDLWCNGGASGSAQISEVTNRLAVAPLSVGSTDAPGRTALSIAQYLADGTVDCRDPSRLRSATLQGLGIADPTRYCGLLDKDGDKRFDVQEDIELRRGENRRSVYFLGFESERRNNLWEPVGYVASFAPQSALVRLTRSGTGFVQLLRHRRLNLQAGAYRLSAMVNTVSASGPSALWIGFFKDGVYHGGRYLPTAADGSWKMAAASVNVPVDGAELVLAASGSVDANVSAISIIREESAMNFDSADQRANWRDDITGARARIVPRGVDSGGPNWAARVLYNPASPSGYPVRNRQLALVAGQRYRICADHRAESTGMTGVMNLVSGGSDLLRSVFAPGPSWQTVCSDVTPTSDDNNLRFGRSSGTGSYLVDNIRIQRL